MTRRAAIYLRISIDHTGEGLAVDRQRHDCEARAKDRNWEVVRTFEESVSAAGSKHREQFELLLEGLERGDYDTVIGWNLDRLTRNRSDTLRLIAIGERKKTLISLIRGMELDMSTPMGRGFAGMLAEFAQMEIEIKGDRQRAAQKQRAELGRPPKGMRPLGYSVNGDVLKDEAKVVQKVYESFNAGTSVRAIALALSGDDRPGLPSLPTLQRHTRTVAIERNAKRAADGVAPRPVPSDGPWSPSTVLGILRNPRYAGYSTYTPKETLKDGNRRRSWRAQILHDDDGEPVRGQWIPIVLPDVWESVQDRLDDVARVTNKKGTDRKHLGSGLYLCGVCGQKVRGHSTRYRCAGHVMRSRDQIDAFVVEVVRRRLALPDLRDLLPSEDDDRLQEIKQEISAHRARIARAERDYDSDNEDERITARMLNKITTDREAKIAALDAERLTLSSGSALGPVLGAEDPCAAFDRADLGLRRSVIDVLCEVRLQPHPRGVKKFDPESVKVAWR